MRRLRIFSLFGKEIIQCLPVRTAARPRPRNADGGGFIGKAVYRCKTFPYVYPITPSQADAWPSIWKARAPVDVRKNSACFVAVLE